MLALLAAAAVAATPACPPLAGVDQLWARPEVRTVIFGETHGTAEAPALFGDAVCLASQRRPVTVALEYWVKEQPEIDAFLATGSPAARAALLAAPSWSPAGRDGRSSQAMLALLDRLRQLRVSGRDIRVVATQPGGRAGGMSQDYYELEMAAKWVEAIPADRGLLLALVGNLHALKLPMDMGGHMLTPAASHLPTADTVSVNIVSGGGSSWNCGEEGCKAHDEPAQSTPPRGVSLTQDPRGYDAVASTGGPSTASPPAAP